MTNSDNFEDFDEEWDEDFDEEDLGAPSDNETTEQENIIIPEKKKNSILWLFLAASVLGGVGFASVKFLTSKKTSIDIPVVQLTDTESNVIFEDASVESEVSVPAGDAVVQGDALIGDPVILPSGEVVNQEAGVLTPMPSNFDGDMPLPDLEISNVLEPVMPVEVVDNSQADVASVDMALEAPVPAVLEEQDFLSKTDMLVSDISNAVTPVSEVTAPEDQSADILIEESVEDVVNIDNTQQDDVLVVQDDVMKAEAIPEEEVGDLVEDNQQDTPIDNIPIIAQDIPVLDAPAIDVADNNKAVDVVVPAPVKPVVVAEKKEQPAPAWILRAVQPGGAVIYDPKTGEMKSIEIGNVVPGIGRVKSIEKVDNRWVIKGTLGKVNQ